MADFGIGEAAAVASLIGTGMSAAGTIAGGNNAASAANGMMPQAWFQSNNYLTAADAADRAAASSNQAGQNALVVGRLNGDTALAGAQGQASEDALKGDYTLSKGNAAAVAQSGSGSDASTILNQAKTAQIADFNREMDISNGQTARNANIIQGANQATDYFNQASDILTNAANLRSSAFNTILNGYQNINSAETAQRMAPLSAAGTVLGGVSNLALNYKQAGGNFPTRSSPFPSNGYNVNYSSPSSPNSWSMQMPWS